MTITRFVLLLSLYTLAVSSHATIIATGGQLQKIAPPSSLAQGTAAATSDTAIFGIDEQVFTLLVDLTVDFVPVGMATISTAPGSTATIAAGTVVQSHIFHQDRLNAGNNTGSATFSAPILGLIFDDLTLDASDFLGNLGTTYPTGQAGRRMIFSEATDLISISADLLSLTALTQQVGATFLDQLRVITAVVPSGTVVSEPGALLLLGLGIAGVGFAASRGRGLYRGTNRYTSRARLSKAA